MPVAVVFLIAVVIAFSSLTVEVNASELRWHFRTYRIGTDSLQALAAALKSPSRKL